MTKPTLGHDDERYRRYRTQLAPGTDLREGLERIRLGHTGALVVLGTNSVVEAISTGGFNVTCPFTATALRELAKMDGGIVLSNDLQTIVWAGVHFTPSAELPTVETGTRHRTADRIALQTNIPVVTVSAAMSTIALFMAGLRYPIESSEQIVMRAEQALATLQRYRTRLDEAVSELSSLEMKNLVTVADLVKVIQSLTMLHRLNEELLGYGDALGIDGRFIQLQLFELTRGIDQLTTLLEADYPGDSPTDSRLDSLDYLPMGDLLDPITVAHALGYGDLSTHLPATGVRLIAQSAQLSTAAAQALIARFGSLHDVVTASAKQLTEVPGVDAKKAQAICEALTSFDD